MNERATPQGSNRRVYPRLDLEVEVTPDSEHNFFTGFTENISEGGVFIATYHQFELGTRFHFTFTLPDRPEPIEALGEVRWIRESHDDARAISPGIGVSFVEIAPQNVERIQNFIRQRESIFYDD